MKITFPYSLGWKLQFSALYSANGRRRAERQMAFLAYHSKIARLFSGVRIRLVVARRRV